MLVGNVFRKHWLYNYYFNMMTDGPRAKETTSSALGSEMAGSKPDAKNAIKWMFLHTYTFLRVVCILHIHPVPKWWNLKNSMKQLSKYKRSLKWIQPQRLQLHWAVVTLLLFCSKKLYTTLWIFLNTEEHLINRFLIWRSLCSIIKMNIFFRK